MIRSIHPKFYVRDAEPWEDDSRQRGVFARDWDEEKELDSLQDRMQAGTITRKGVLKKARELITKYPGNLEYLNLLGTTAWAEDLRDDAAEYWESAYKLAMAAIPPDFKGKIEWLETDNRSFLRCCYGHILGLTHFGQGKLALPIARKMLRWNPNDNQGVRFLVGDLQLLSGALNAALKTYIKTAPENPVDWYSAGLIAFRQHDFVKACTYLRRGIAGNPYVAEGLTGRSSLANHLYWHASNLNDIDFAIDFLNAPIPKWQDSDLERDFVDWVFNSSHVLQERADLMALHEATTYSHANDAEGFAIKEQIWNRKQNLLTNINDDVSNVMVRKVENRWGQKIWPWDRQGLDHPVRS